MGSLRRGGIGVALAVLACAAITGHGPAAAQRKEVPPSRAAAQYSFAPIVKKAAPAVVNVYVRARVPTFVSPFADDPLFRRFFGEQLGRPVERMQNSLGSGVIVSADGVVITNTHVVKIGGAAEIRIALADRREFDAKVVLQDEKSDIAVLRIEGGDGRFPYLEFEDSDAIEVGDQVLAIGNPFGVGQTVTSGIVSALARTEVGRNGCPGVHPDGCRHQPRQLRRCAGRHGGQGGRHQYGDLLPLRRLAWRGLRHTLQPRQADRRQRRDGPQARAAVARRQARRRDPRLGRGAGIDPRLRRPGEPALRQEPGGGGRAEAGDVIVAVDGHEVADVRGLQYRLTTRGIGQRAKLDVVRKGQRLTVEVALRAAPKGGKDDVRNLSGAHPFDGARVANIGPAVADELGLDEQEGVVILSVRQGSTSARIGFQPGDIIQQVGRERIATLAELEAVLKERQRVWLVQIKRGGQSIRLQLAG